MKNTRRLYLYSAIGIALLSAAGVAVNVMASNDDEAPVSAKPALTVNLEAPQPMPLPVRFGAHGTIAAWQEASIGSEVSGLRLSAVHVNVGDVVKRGQVLASFAPETPKAELAQMEAAVAEAEAAAIEAVANAERARSLQPTGAMSKQQITQYLTAEQTAKARVEAQKAAAQAHRLRLAKTQVLAPDGGVISSRSATVGAVTAGGQELFRLIRGGRLEWRAEVTSSEIVRLRAGMPARVVAADGSSVEGRVRMVAPTVDANTRSGIVYVDLPAAPGLKAGMFAQGDFDLGSSTALTVPQQALVMRDGFNYVFRVGPGDRVVQTRVTVGRRNGQRVEVIDGLQSEALLVARGAGFLNDGDLVKVVQPTAPSQVLAEAHSAVVPAKAGTQ
ncbi:MAG TPA: efflux RND transporter periplasmic adaptor subunit [Burkholderiaceae bacterium]|nr:efflux RND transporter periplasmic adaptor subunit [Burkholderiaceae bacterium]